MKKIINGKKYDTDTAKKVGEYWSSSDLRDFHWWSESLYQKKTGEFFLYGSGNAASKYRESCGNNTWSSGSHIEPLDYEAAQKWAEEHLTAEEYEDIFGEVAEDDTSVVVSIRLTAAAAETARREAAKRGIGIGDYISKKIMG